MAKKQQKPPAAISAVPVEYEEAEMELLQVDVGDMVKLKQILDETVASTLLGTLAEDYRWENVKLSIMVWHPLASLPLSLSSVR